MGRRTHPLKMLSLKSSLDRFQGCLVGALIGDCLGAPFEGSCWAEGRGIAKEKIIKLINPNQMNLKDNGSKLYTDDTAMAKSVCASLLHLNKFDSVDMATRFTKEFMSDKKRGYGGGVRCVFNSWAECGINYKNVLVPSINQFDGSGSFGNGGAMRVAPVALFAKSVEECIHLAKESARLTHNHESGYMGAVLQALAVYMCIYSGKQIKWMEFLQDLKTEMTKLENVKNPKDDFCEKEAEKVVDIDEEDKLYEWTRSNSFSYTHQLDVIQELLTIHFQNDKEDDTVCVIKRIGRDISAQQAVPAAIYCFLRNLELGFEETLYYAISLGGDTDTICTMCSAMSGAYYGYSMIPLSWKNVCESHDEVKLFTDRFYELHTTSS